MIKKIINFFNEIVFLLSNASLRYFEISFNTKSRELQTTSRKLLIEKKSIPLIHEFKI